MSSDALPPALSSMWRLCRLGYRYEPRGMALTFALSQLSALPDALLALFLAGLGQAALDQRATAVRGYALALGLSVAATWVLRTVSGRVSRRFRDKVTLALEAHVARLIASIPTLAHHERPAILDRLAVLRDQIFVLDHLYMSLFSTVGWVLRLGVTVALLISVHPALAGLALVALPTALASAWRPAVERQAHERGAQSSRLARHLFDLATTAAPAKEVRVLGLGPVIATERRAAWERWYGPIARERSVSAVWYTAGWALFGAAYVGAVAFASTHAPAGQVLLVLAAGARLSGYVGATIGEIGFLRGIWMDGSQRLAWLEDYADSVRLGADSAVPDRLSRGIRLDHVSFAYPGTDRKVLDDVSLALPAGSVVAVVGENGAGKSTLVKLLTRFYDPTSGSITVDDQPLDRIPADGWRSRVAGAFQDFFRFELRARRTIGLGDLPRLDDEPAVVAAVDRAGAADVTDKLGGLDTQLGPTWPGGVDLSFGQWQKLALARGFMRDEPLLLVLDEPTAALDAETEHALFERYAAAARAPERGRITVLVSHRFSTVRMADLIVVLDGSKLAEVGSHDELMARGGPYSQLYGIQAAAYR